MRGTPKNGTKKTIEEKMWGTPWRVRPCGGPRDRLGDWLTGWEYQGWLSSIQASLTMPTTPTANLQVLVDTTWGHPMTNALIRGVPRPCSRPKEVSIVSRCKSSVVWSVWDIMVPVVEGPMLLVMLMCCQMKYTYLHVERERRYTHDFENKHLIADHNSKWVKEPNMRKPFALSCYRNYWIFKMKETLYLPENSRRKTNVRH